ncbi:MAG: endonuclease V [Candidatus Omnitrophica bacterium]|nr:endonuclease V [Candidatus Omnitrophota bacterium]
MRITHLHSWNISPQKAIKIQLGLKNRISLRNLSKKIRIIAGCDASFKDNKAIGVVVVMRYPELKVIETIKKESRINFPYIPGLLTFREGPVLLRCFKVLHYEPDIIIFDGQGIAHFRNMGLATHLGILLSKPSIGCAKSRLTGIIKQPALKKGAYTLIKDSRGEIIGATLRSRDNIKPIFVSPGHKINLKDSMRIILGCSRGFRIPEPLRYAHHLTKAQ